MKIIHFSIKYIFINLLVILFFCWAPNVISSERTGSLSLRKFELLDRFSAMDRSIEVDFYIRGISDGLAFANTFLESNGKIPFFCADSPPGVPELRSMLRDQIEFLNKVGKKTEQAMERTSAAAILLQKMREKYPCKTRSIQRYR
uniref:hypothetical protein n=1 Tax=Methylobacterium sp. TaxID=409 RepID=UPI0020C994C6|nr:hypothetical protein [Methylobacterium sp.]